MADFTVKFKDDSPFNVSFIDRSEMKIGFDNVQEISTYETYTGEYEITPSDEIQVLNTENKMCINNIVIQPIPQNYGRIAYNGYSLTVS